MNTSIKLKRSLLIINFYSKITYLRVLEWYTNYVLEYQLTKKRFCNFNIKSVTALHASFGSVAKTLQSVYKRYKPDITALQALQIRYEGVTKVT